MYLAKNPPLLQILPHPKFHPNQRFINWFKSYGHFALKSKTKDFIKSSEARRYFWDQFGRAKRDQRPKGDQRPERGPSSTRPTTRFERSETATRGRLAPVYSMLLWYGHGPPLVRSFGLYRVAFISNEMSLKLAQFAFGIWCTAGVVQIFFSATWWKVCLLTETLKRPPTVLKWTQDCNLVKMHIF